MIPNEVDYVKIGQRIRDLRIQKKLTQADLSASIGCSNNHLSHIETAQCKVSLSMLLRISLILDQSIEYFLLDTPYARPNEIIDQSIAGKLQQCNAATLVAVSQMLDTLLELQRQNSDNAD